MNRVSTKIKLQHLLNELKEDYLKTFPEKLQNLRQLTVSRDWTGLEQQYHKLKGTGKTYGFPEISLVCQKLEDMAQSQNHRDPEVFEKALTLLENLHQSYLQNRPCNLEDDAFSRSLLALKLK